MIQDFDAALTTFLQGVQRIVGDDSTITTNVLQRYIRVVCTNGNYTHAFCFIDRSGGEVLKTGGWEKPAKTKQSRGNIFDANNDLASITKYGLAYLRR